MKKQITELLKAAELLGLGLADSNAIREFIEHGEYKVAVEWMIDQLYEFDVKISTSFFEQASSISIDLKIESRRVELLKRLVE